MADWIKDGGNYIARLGAGFDLTVTRENDGFRAEVFGKHLPGAHGSLKDAQDAAVVYAHDTLMGAIRKL